MNITPLFGLQEPAGLESFTRTSAVIYNMSIIDVFGIIAYAFVGIPWPGCSKGELIKDGNSRPQSQTISGPNGITGSMTFSFATNTITETLSITAPDAWSVIKTTDRTDLSEVCS